ncbi:hypothetical protein Clacol_009622 [Clathrus columnatus]|uniref:non-specific serine/threonine protein kinase n=1 Tax=Clathrus columnatus TaxID=1419009 RepID=A0AAV5AL09_9AGAM|nr:hypothetical protein Clacol_009622 [Clathrus columnatus]
MSLSPVTPDAEGGMRLVMEAITLPCEWAEKYRPGGYHPVHLGDEFNNGAYTIIRKLGHGSFSTVWLAADSLNKRYVALKIMMAKESATDTELEMIQFLFQKASSDPRSEHIITPLDTFVHEGPNGKHRCLVFEAMGPSATVMLDELPGNKPGYYDQRRSRYPKLMAKTILVHTLRGLAFLHGNNIVHGDVQPGNILFTIKDISDIDDTIPNTVAPVFRRDGKVDRWAPKKVYLEQTLHKYVPLGPNVKVKISDLGCGKILAFWFGNPPSKPGMPTALRAPELILGRPLTAAIDIWAFGCLMFEFLTATSLFEATTFGWDEQQRNDADDDMLIQFYKVIGKLPDSIIYARPRANKWYDPVSGELLDSDEKEDEEDDYPDDGIPDTYTPLESRFEQTRLSTIDDAESTVICSIIRQVLNYSPEARPSASDLLEHPWFTLE